MGMLSAYGGGAGSSTPGSVATAEGAGPDPPCGHSAREQQQQLLHCQVCMCPRGYVCCEMSCGVFPARRALGIGPALNTRKGGKIRIAVFCDAAGTKQAVMTHGHNTAELDRLTVGKVYRVQRLKIDNRLPDIKIAEHGVYSMQFQEGRSSFRYGLGQVCWSVLCVQDRPRSLCREVDVADFPAYIPTFQRLEAILEELVLAHEALPPQVRSKCPPGGAEAASAVQRHRCCGESHGINYCDDQAANRGFD